MYRTEASGAILRRICSPSLISHLQVCFLFLSFCRLAFASPQSTWQNVAIHRLGVRRPWSRHSERLIDFPLDWQLADFFWKGHIESIFGFVGHRVSVPLPDSIIVMQKQSQLICNKWAYDCDPIKLFFTKTGRQEARFGQFPDSCLRHNPRFSEEWFSVG